VARCRCTAGSCECHLAAGDNVTVTGTGAVNEPWVISASASAQGVIEFTNTPEVELAVVGAGSVADPLSVSASLPWVDPTAGTAGQVLTKLADGSWAPGPAVTAAPGAIFTGPGVTGDGSAGNPLRICLATYDDLKNAVNC
jgi:hypothetical protein